MLAEHPGRRRGQTDLVAGDNAVDDNSGLVGKDQLPLLCVDQRPKGAGPQERFAVGGLQAVKAGKEDVHGLAWPALQHEGLIIRRHPADLCPLESHHP